MTNEKAGGDGDRAGAIGVLDMALWDAAAKIEDTLAAFIGFFANKNITRMCRFTRLVDIIIPTATSML